MFGEEPDLELVGPNDFADDEIVGAVIAGVGRLLGHGMRFLENEFVGFEEAGDLHGGLFSSARWARDHRGFGDVGRHRKADSAEELNALGDGIYELVLFSVMLIEEQVELVKGVARDLPVVLFVHVAQGHCVGEELVQIFDAVRTDFFVETDRELRNFVVRLNLVRFLMKDGARTLGARLRVRIAVPAICFAVLGTHKHTFL